MCKGYTKSLVGPKSSRYEQISQYHCPAARVQIEAGIPEQALP